MGPKVASSQFSVRGMYIARVGNNAAYGQVIADQESGEGYYAFVHIAKLYADDEMNPEVKAWWDAYVAPTLVIALLWGCGSGSERTTETSSSGVRGVTDTEIVLGNHTDLSGPVAIWGVGASSASPVKVIWTYLHTSCKPTISRRGRLNSCEVCDGKSLC